ncbi:MAG: ribosomal-processing cysteine protease Prp [Bacillota bacterium]
MITVQVTRREGHIGAFDIEGHSDYAEKGRDIVCAAVSALSQGAVMGLERVVGLSPVTTIRDGWLSLQRLSNRSLTVDQRQQAQAILETMVVALKDIAREYPRNMTVVDQQG